MDLNCSKSPRNVQPTIYRLVTLLLTFAPLYHLHISSPKKNYPGKCRPVKPVNPSIPHIGPPVNPTIAFHTSFKNTTPPDRPSQFLLVGRLLRSHPTKDIELVREEIRNLLGTSIHGDVEQWKKRCPWLVRDFL